MTSPVTNRAPNSLLRYSKASTDFTVRVLYKLLWPKFDTLIRLALAQAYFASGVMKMTRATLAATTHNFPIRFMAPVTAAYGGVSVEAVGGIFIAIGSTDGSRSYEMVRIAKRW